MSDEEISEAEIKKDIESAELDPNFKYEIAKEPGGENILYCFQCGTCSAICPVAAQNEKYDPRRIIRMAILGMREEVLKSEALWLCSTCYSCYVRCPQDVKITSLLAAIQNIAAREGHLHSSYQAGLEMVEKSGRTVEVSEFENSRREKLACPEIKENPEKVKKIIEYTGILKKRGSEE
jgi:heterodisulfide reductase subunit C